MILVICLIVTVGLSIYWVTRHRKQKEQKEQFDKRFSPEPVELDPIEDAALMGPHHWVRMELFSLVQKGYVETTTREGRRGSTIEGFKLGSRSTSTDSTLSPVQKKILSQFKELDTENEGVGGGAILAEVEEWEEVAPRMREKKAKYEEAGLAYPEGLLNVGCGPTGVFLIIYFFILLIIAGTSGVNDGRLFEALGSIFLIIIPCLTKVFQEGFPVHPPKAEASLALMREQWGSKTIQKAQPDDWELQHQNLLIMGALGTAALAGTAYASFDDAFPMAAAAGSSGGGSCGSCSSCGGCGGGDGGGGGCGGGCGGCGGG